MVKKQSVRVPRYMPTEAEIQAAIARQRQQRRDLARRVDDGPLTILVEPGAFGPTPRHEKLPQPKWYIRFYNLVRKVFRRE